MTHPDMIEGDTPLLAPDAARARDWQRVEACHRVVRSDAAAGNRLRALQDYQAELAGFVDRYWPDLCRAFGGAR